MRGAAAFLCVALATARAWGQTDPEALGEPESPSTAPMSAARSA